MGNQPTELRPFFFFTFVTFTILHVVAHTHDIFLRVLEAPVGRVAQSV